MTNENLYAFADLIAEVMSKLLKMFYQTKAWLKSIAAGDAPIDYRNQTEPYYAEN